MQQVYLVLSTTGNLYCPAAADTAVLSFINPLSPAFSAGPACVGASTMFTDQSTVSNGTIIAWNWDFGNGTTASGESVSTTYITAGQYTVSLTVIALNGCSATITQTIDVLDAPVAGFGYSGDPFDGTPIAFLDSSLGATSWFYDFGDGFGASLDQNPIYTYPEPGQYIVVQTVTNAAGCADQDSLLLVIGENDILPPKLPNAFSPNGDGVNDVFYVRGGPFLTIDLRIYNGWGELIFQTTDPLFGWDGTYKGEPEINGVYQYTVKATTVDGVEHSRPGKVALIR
jgi:gliding motility-associated-like protein